MSNSKKQRVLYGYDLDGTLSEPVPKRNKPFFKQNAQERADYNNLKAQHYAIANLLMKPQEPFVIVTSRKEEYRGITENWCKKQGLRPMAIFFMAGPRKQEVMIEHKATTCQKAGVTLYFEDDKEIARALVQRGINVTIVNHK